MAVDPRLQGNEDKRMPVMFPDQRILENIGGIRGGTAYTDDVEGWANDSRWLEFYANTAVATASPHLARFYLKLTSASDSIWGSAVHAEYQQAHTSGNSGGGQAVHAEAVLAEGAPGVVSGHLAALRGVLTVDAETRSVDGTYAVCYLSSNFGADNTMPTATSFIAVENAGSVKVPFLFHLVGGNFEDSCIATSAGSSATKYLKINVNGTTYKIDLLADS